MTPNESNCNCGCTRRSFLSGSAAAVAATQLDALGVAPSLAGEKTSGTGRPRVAVVHFRREKGGGSTRPLSSLLPQIWSPTRPPPGCRVVCPNSAFAVEGTLVGSETQPTAIGMRTRTVALPSGCQRALAAAPVARIPADCVHRRLGRCADDAHDDPSEPGFPSSYPARGSNCQGNPVR